MKLIKCYVSSFGKLKDFSLDFSSNLNVIKEDNGWGKSTLATFIKAMFYGLDGSGKRGILDNERKRYKPWNSTQTFGGYVHFEWGGNEYIIERYFGNKESEDTLTLKDAKSGKFYTNTENLGKRIFEIDEEGFLSTTYFSQKDFEAKSNTSLTAKFNAMCDNGDSEAFDTALFKIEQKAKSYKYSGDRGLIPDAKRELFFVNEEIEKSIRAKETARQLKDEVLARESKGKELQKLSDELAKRVAVAGKTEVILDRKNRYEKLIKDREILAKDKISAENVLNGNHVSDVEISPFEQKAREIDRLSQRIAELNSDLSLFEQNEKEQKPKKNKKILPVLFCVSSAVSLLCAILFFILGGVLFSVGIIGAVFFVLFAILTAVFVKRNSEESEKEQDSPQKLIAQQRREELGNCLTKKQTYQNQVDEYISRFSLGEYKSRIGALEDIKKLAFVYKNICADLSLLDSEIKALEVDKAEFINVKNNNENIAVLQVELRRVQDEYTRNSIELANFKASIKAHEERASKLIDFESKKSDVLERIANMEKELKTLTLTAKYLRLSDENLKIKYREPLQNSLNKYLTLISGQNNAKIDVDLNVTVQETGGEKSTDYFSKGYRNLFEICKRFALTDVLFKKEKPFIILDDPFYNLDDEKVKASLELVQKLSNEYQIVYFVCHESRRI